MDMKSKHWMQDYPVGTIFHNYSFDYMVVQKMTKNTLLHLEGCWKGTEVRLTDFSTHPSWRKGRKIIPVTPKKQEEIEWV